MKASIQFKSSRGHNMLQWVAEFSFKENVDILSFLKNWTSSEMPNQNTMVERKELHLFYQPKSWFKKKKA